MTEMPPESTVVSISLRARALHSGSILHAIRNMLTATYVVDSVGLACLTLAVISVEALVNEIFDHMTTIDASTAGTIEGPIRILWELVYATSVSESEDRTSLIDKVKLLSSVLQRRRSPFDRQPFQDLNLLIRMRNWLTHSRPERFVSNGNGLWSESQKLRKQVAERLQLNIPDNAISGFLGALSARQVAVFSFETAIQVRKEVVSWLPGHWAFVMGHQSNFEAESLRTST